MIGIRMGGVLVVAAPVRQANLVDQADHGLMVMMGHESSEQHHHHRQQGRYYSDLPEHQGKIRKKTIKNPNSL
jgi:hypothetical protein